MSTGSDAKTMPVTREYDEGYERIFGKGTRERGVWVQDPTTGRLVPVSEYQSPAQEQAINAPVIVGRHYENTAIQTGLGEYRDVGSRKRYREYLKETGYTHASDYTGQWKKAAEQREKTKKGVVPSKTRRETLERAFHKLRGY